jgi:hypothetical protein
MNDNKQKATITQLPKPVTVTGSAFEPPEEEKIEEIAPVETPENNDDDTDVLPMPVAFGDDDEDIQEEKENKTFETQKKTEESDELSKEKRFDDIPSLSSDKPQESEDEDDSLESNESDESKKVDLKSVKDDQEEIFLPTQPKDSEEVKNEGLPPRVELPQEGNDSFFAMPSEKDSSSPVSQTEEVEVENSTTEEEVHKDFVIPNLKPQSSISDSAFSNFSDLRNPYENKNDIDKIVHKTPSVTQSVNPPAYTNTNNPVPPQTTPPHGNNYDSNQPSTGKSAFAKIALGLVALLTGGSLVVGGYFAANKMFSDNQEVIPQQAEVTPDSPTPTVPAVATPTPEPDPTPTPEPEIEKSDVVIRILNGSGVKGAAANAQRALEKAGFEKISSGNADKFTYKETIVDYKEEYESFVDVIEEDLGSTYEVVKGEQLKDSNKYDIIITLGKTE